MWTSFMTTSVQAFDCTNLTLDPDVLTASEVMIVEKRDRLQLNEAIVMSIPQTGFSRTQSCIPGDASYITACESGFMSVMELQPNEMGLQAGTPYDANFTVIDALGNSNVCTRVIRVTGEQENFCSPASLTNVEQTQESYGAAFSFQGCAGGATAANRPVVLITDPTQQNRTVAELTVTPGQPNGNQPGGVFAVLKSNLPSGVYDAQLFVSAAAQGAPIRFEATQLQTCETDRTCTVDGKEGKQTCHGQLTNGVCSYENNDCTACLYCGDNICSAGETTLRCPNDCKSSDNSDEKERINQFDFCTQLPEGAQRESCNACVQINEGDELKPKAMYTAVGCVRVDNTGLVRQIIQILLSVGGLIALISILAGAFIFSTSQGDANKVKQAKDMITAAVSGILFIVFSTIILDFIGVQILRLPGLS